MTVLRGRVLTPRSPTEALFYADGVVAFEGGLITHVGPYDGRAVHHHLPDALLTPGFVDAHVHFPQTRIIGSASGPLLQWLERSTFPEEARFADPEHASTVAEVFAQRLLAAGTTLALAYSSVHPSACDALFRALDRAGLRAIAGPVLMDEDCPEALRLDADRALAGLERLRDTWHGAGGRLQLAVIPRFALCCSIDLMQRAGAYARAHELWVSTHVAETVEECRIACAKFDARDYLEVYERAGLVHERSVYAHCIHLSDREWGRFRDAGAVVAHCPDSNHFLGSGHMPVGRVMAMGIPLAVGTDVAAGRSFFVPHTLSHAYDNGLATGTALAPETLLWWGTRGGALALDSGHTGALQAGLAADVVAWPCEPWIQTAQQALGDLLFHTGGGPTTAVWIDGQLVRNAPRGSP